MSQSNLPRGLGGKLIAAAMSILLGLSMHAHAQEVIPDFYREPGINPNRDYVNQSYSEHIDPFTGALQLHYVDIHLPGNGGFGLDVVRSYNSASVDPSKPAAYESQAGLGWTVHFGRVMKTKNSTICTDTNKQSVLDDPILELPDGSRQILAFTGGTSPLALTTERWRADCITSGSQGLAIYSPNGTRYDMTQLVNVGTAVAPVYAWYTTKITDRNGNYATIAYAASSSPEISSVTTSDGRSLSFTYLDSGTLSRRISTVSGAGQTYTYGYTAVSGVSAEYFLTSVTRPDSTSWSYSYNGSLTTAGSYVMSSMRFPQGGTISYGYGYVYFDQQANPSYRSQVVTGKSMSTGGSWSFSYSPGAAGTYDTTTVNTPSGTITYKHVGPNYSSSGTVWMVGLLMSKQIGSTQTETYTWSSQSISIENLARPGEFLTKVDTGAVNAPVLASKVITRDGASFTTNYSNFDAYGNPQTVAESGPNGGSRTTTLSYYVNTSKWIVKQPQNESYSGSTITRAFDSNGNMTSVNEDGVTTSYSYNSDGTISTATFPRSLVHNYSSYKRGIAQTESQPESVTIYRVVSDAGNITSETDGESHTTGYGYDGLNRVTSISYPVGNPVSISYTATSKSATRSGLTESTAYDGFGRPSSVTLGGVARGYQFDALGRKTFESNPGSSAGDNYQYDILDRVTKVTHADSTSRTISYGAASMTVLDERSKSTSYAYRSYGDPSRQFVMSVAAADSSANYSIGRNTKDLITSIAQGGLTRSYGYNGNYYLTSVINPETGTTTYGRDPAGNMTSRSVGSSGTTTYGYDGQNRLISISYPGSTPSVSQTYTKTHKLKTSASSVASRTYSYDNNDNLQSESVAVDGYTLTTSYGYNGNDQLTSITYPVANHVVSYSPDVLGRPTAASGYASGVSYWPSGQINTITYANGTTTTYGQNSRLWPSGFSTQKGSSVYVNSTYGYDGLGNITSISDSVDSSYSRGLSYDNINRLTGVTGPWGSGTISYNGLGNITGQSLGSWSISYSYDGSNRLSSVSGARSASYTYDAYGNIIGASSTSYIYDGAPNLTCVNCSDSVNKIAYAYDGLNKRISVTKAGVKTYEVYGSNGNLLAEYTPSLANKLVEFVYLGGKRIAQRRTDTTVSSTTALSVAPSPATVNQQVVLTATVTGSSPTGTVAFSDGGTSLGSPVAVGSGGVATLTISFGAWGSHSLRANYQGDLNNAPSASATVPLTVNAISTSTALTGSPNPAYINQPVVLSATVNGSNPTGSVVFKDGAANLNTVSLSGNAATLVTAFSATGNHSLTAAYLGDAQNGASVSSALTQVIVPLTASSTVLSATPNPAGLNESVTLSANVSGDHPSGSVTFKDGSTVLGQGTINSGIATYSQSFSALGVHSLTAVYAGDGQNLGSTSSPVSLQVNQLSTKQLSAVLSIINSIVLDDGK